jgi:transposase
MAQNFLSCDRDQVLLLPPDMAAWLPGDHLARFVIETVEELGLEAVYAYYRLDGRGRPAHDPAMMVALVLYAYAVGVTSSRAIERRCVEDVAFRVITADRQPDHATVARFLIRHRDALSDLFFEVLALCERAGMLRVGTVAVDSTKLAANAALEQNRTVDGLRAEAERIIGEAVETDRREDELYGEKRGDELPDELADPRTRKARIKELLEQARKEREAIEAERAVLHARQAERLARKGKRPGGRPPAEQPSLKQQRVLSHKKYNLTDPDSGIVRHRGMLLQGYNIQTAVSDGQIILAAKATSAAPDGGQLAPTIAAARENLARLEVTDQIAEIVADGGYWNAAQIRELKHQGSRVLVPPSSRSHPHGPGRMQPEAREMKTLLATDEGQARYRRRQQIIEPVFAHIKHHRGITRLLRRGKQAVQAEIDLIATTHNLLKLYRAIPTTT